MQTAGGESTDASPTVDDARFNLAPGEGRRGRAARGTLINSAFLVGLNLLALIKGFAVAGFISVSDYGVWGLLIVAFTTLYGLVQIGVNDKYIQQDASDQERAFQVAFTLQLMLSGMFTVLMVATMPLWAAVFDTSEVMLPGIALAAAMPAAAFRVPLWTFYRRLDYLRQRQLQAADPLTSIVVTVALAAAGFGYWAFVIGTIVGAWAGALVAVRASPYRLRLVYERGTAREYATFSGPLLFQGACAAAVSFGPVLVAQRTLGTVAVGAIAIANNISVYSNKVEQVITSTIYPVICSVKNQRELLQEAFLKSNRMGLLWATPTGLGLVLFAPDLVKYVLGARWEVAVPLIQAFGVIAVVNQIGFNWTAFYRALGDTKPIAVAGGVMAVGATAVAVPLVFVLGLEGFALGMLLANAGLVAVRLVYLTRLFALAPILRNVGRGMLPGLVAMLTALAVRLVAFGGPRDELQAVIELAVFGSAVTATTLVLERGLLDEFRGYMRRSSPKLRQAA